MEKEINLVINFTDSNIIELMRLINSNFEPFNQNPPNIITDGFEENEGSDNWIEDILPNYKYSVSAYWGDMFEYEGRIHYDRKNNSIEIEISYYLISNAKDVMSMIASLPWAIASFYTLHEEWEEYIACRLDIGHVPHGWACAFKGKGHNCLVSRRWLEYNPWHLIRDEEHDISFIQFHELDADPEKALSQAKPGHERMGFSDIGGFIRRTRLLKLEESNAEDATVIYSDEGKEVGRGYLVDGGYNYKHFPQGVYHPDERKLDIVIIERELSPRELLELSMIRYFQDLEGDNPVERIACVFLREEEAKPYLQEIWLRGIECWVYTPQGILTRIDEDYQPVYEHPEWVKQLRQKQQQQEQQAKLDRVTTRLSQIKTEMKRLDDRIKNLSGGSYDRALHSRIKELKAKSSKLIGEKNQLEREKADLEQEIDQANL